MYLGTADHLLAYQQLVVREHLRVAGIRGDAQLFGVDERHASRGDNADAQPLGSMGELASYAHQIPAQILQAGDDRGIGLHDGALELGGEVGGQPLEHPWTHRRDLAGLQIDDVELLLHAEGERRGRGRRGGGGTASGRDWTGTAGCSAARMSPPMS